MCWTAAGMRVWMGQLSIRNKFSGLAFDSILFSDADNMTVRRASSTVLRFVSSHSVNFTKRVAMWNYRPDAWPEIRRVLTTVPLHHPLWRIDESAGESIWYAASDSTIRPVMPVLEFDVLLILIDAWFSGSVLRPRCEWCEMDFQNLGLLVQYFRVNHSLCGTPI
jgi:hypothetical protein